MKTIILYPEQDNLSVLNVTVKNEKYKELQKMQYSGGFRRYGIELYDNNPEKNKYTNEELLKLNNWLSKVFIKN